MKNSIDKINIYKLNFKNKKSNETFNFVFSKWKNR